jgi:hypothetical protein
VYSFIAFGKVFSGSIPDFSKNGLRSTRAPEEQNLPTLFVVKDEITSGALPPPARRAWLILSSVMLPTTFTWIWGCAFSKPATRSLTAFTSAGALQACQKLRVVSLEASSEAPESAWPVQAVARRAMDAEAARAMAAFRDIPGMAGSP